MRNSLRAIAVMLLLACAAPAVAQQRELSNLDARPVRDWVRDAVVYEVFPRNYSREGTFNAITADLDRLDALGVTVLWLMPIHPIGQERRKGTHGSPYSVRDFYAVHPDYGTKEDFKRLVAEAHRRGMRVIIDMVANHTAWDSVMMRTPELYTRDASGKVIPPDPGWQDVADLNYDNPKLRDYMLDVLKYWVREFDIDGYRCDVAGFVPTDFWERARVELEAVKPDIVMLAEWHDPALLVKAFDLDYSWPLHRAITVVLQEGAPAARIREAWEEERRIYPRGALHMRFSDNHDEERAIARFGEAGALAAQALVFTMDGVPLVYNGMEAGDTTESGAPALFEKLPVFWSIRERRPQVARFYERMIALRASSPALRRGTLEWVPNSHESRVATYVRRQGNEEMLVAINFSNEPVVALVGVAGAGFQDVTPGLGEAVSPARPATLPAVALEAFGFRVFRR